MDRIGNMNIIQVVDVAGNGNMVRIGKYDWKWKYCRNRKIIPETEILNICSKRKLIPESEILNIVRIGNEFRNREFNRKRIVRISIGRGLPDEGPARSRAIAQQASAPHEQPRPRQAQQVVAAPCGMVLNGCGSSPRSSAVLRMRSMRFCMSSSLMWRPRLVWMPPGCSA